MATLDETAKIIARIAHCGADEIKAETALKDIKADSLHWVQIIVAAENAYDIEIDFDKMKEFSTVGDFASYIDSLKAAA
jgi:acyl carrier protein